MRSKLRAIVWDAEFDSALAATTNAFNGIFAKQLLRFVSQREINTSAVAFRVLARQVVILHQALDGLRCRATCSAMELSKG